MARVWERLEAQPPASAEEGRQHIASSLARLEQLWEVIEIQPSILRGQTLGGLYRDLNSLIDVLASCSPFAAEAFLPTRAALCRAFLTSKLNFCRLLGVVAKRILCGDVECPEILHETERVQTSAVCDLMAEDLLRLIASDEQLTHQSRSRATRVLVQMWEYRTDEVVSSLFRVLESAWQAKTHVTINYGTLGGVAELLNMMSEGCDPLFVDCFSREEVSEDEELALQEFVFNIRYERLQELQHHMAQYGSSSVNAEDVASILHVPMSQLRVRTCTCEDMLFTFRERQSMAGHRRAFDIQGPKRTAEQYLMTFLIERAREVDIMAPETS